MLVLCTGRQRFGPAYSSLSPLSSLSSQPVAPQGLKSGSAYRPGKHERHLCDQDTPSLHRRAYAPFWCPQCDLAGFHKSEKKKIGSMA
ncbi:Piso0_003313 [Millerozyma farinosa CBS 7064]|uniref:Piso0_003313 protein n=1 Tax=Pichia sorbitophila (strain ATCC MYA-4447 / BCRC 22081 / CBS 7064 / NBRC 10061 / NRRL Y-12695) TaxID=559304 RepID=G8YHS4_PICSO|nr:Piso0_003313 [Millerozyma farinosa CBS 7064]CCE80976.1 Piso0_003313 [Millerozyma farinosa CBS 7064]